MKHVVAGFADGEIPVVVSRCSVAEFRCRIPVLPGGDGALTEPLEARTARCGCMTDLIVGSAPTCRKHIADMLSLLGENRVRSAELNLWLAEVPA